MTIIGEEFGESCKAAIDTKYKDEPIENMIAECAQAAAMCIRQIQHLLVVKYSEEKREVRENDHADT
jgi:hypothetical protein